MLSFILFSRCTVPDVIRLWCVNLTSPCFVVVGRLGLRIHTAMETLAQGASSMKTVPKVGAVLAYHRDRSFEALSKQHSHSTSSTKKAIRAGAPDS